METKMAPGVETPMAPRPEGGVSVERFRRISEVFAAPKGYTHYEMNGTWDENRKKFLVAESSDVFTEYKFGPHDKANEAQIVEKESFRLVRDTTGKESKKPVKYNFDNGKWEDKNLLRRFIDTFQKRSTILAVLDKGMQGDQEVLSLHTLELRRPTGDNVKAAESTDSDALFLDLELKAGYHREEMQAINKTIEEFRREAKYYKQTLRDERRERSAAAAKGPLDADDNALAREFFAKARPR